MEEPERASDRGGAVEPAAETFRPSAEAAGRRPPTYSIVMVVHNALEMVQLSTLRTLRHTNGQDAELVAVDNGSTDGAGEWLELLARRGDIRLIRAPSNLGHGPAIELARRQIRSPYLVTLDSDAFPLADDWLEQLRNRLVGKAKVAGILHHRDYIHPSCLMIAQQTLEELGVSFLNEKHLASKFDVAERISHEVKRRGWEISGLRRTGAQRKGSASEPVYLGSEYEGIVHHQWYTTRSVRERGGAVDDVPPGAIEASLAEQFESYHGEPRDATVVVGVRAPAGEPERLRNARAALAALNLQDLPRHRYRIIVVEQDAAPRARDALAPLADRYVFAPNPGGYNRGWAFNVGASLPGGEKGLLCLIDADILAQPDLLSRGLTACRAGARAVSPYTEIAYLDPRASEDAIRDRWASPLRPFRPESYGGAVHAGSQGGCIWVEAALYREIGGHDERFRGWGREDREFWERLSRATSIKRLPGRLLHLHHEPPAMDPHQMEANRRLADEQSHAMVTGLSDRTGDPDRYAAESS